MRKNQRQNGFTLVELMIALIVSSIVLSAVAVLANAATTASKATDQMGKQQSHLRMASAHLADLIRRANRVTSASEQEFTLWHDMNADGLASNDELTRVGRGLDGHTLSVGGSEIHTNCRNIAFAYDKAAPDTEFVTVWFDLQENGQTQRHSVSAGLRGSDAHMK